MNAISRRTFLSRASAFSASGLLGLTRPATATPPPETDKLRLVHAPAMCLAPQYLAEDLLRAEGFAQVEYVSINAVPGKDDIPEVLAAGAADFSMDSAPTYMPYLDAGNPITVLAGIHAGCYELYANERIRSIRDLRGKRIAVSRFEVEQIFLSSVLAYIGMDPRTDVEWIKVPAFADSMRLYIQGKVDAFLAFPPQPQELRSRKVGRVLLSTTFDRPWSHYFCCMLGGNRDFVARNPAATKRVVRAFLKATEICVTDPERAARFMVDKGYVQDYGYAIGLVKELPYKRWREANPEDTLRFHALRLHEVGMIKSNPQKLIAQGTDWRFLNELKRELKA
jgi:NitT/TauT family transport system substrate-binding protein